MCQRKIDRNPQAQLYHFLSTDTTALDRSVPLLFHTLQSSLALKVGSLIVHN